MDKKKPDTAIRIHRFYCDFGHVHNLSDVCRHRDEYRIYPSEFKIKLYELFGNKYPSDITDRIRNETMAKCNRF